jgi:hypothetical protein
VVAQDAVDPRAEARARAGDAHDPRVLEPSPPAVTAAPWFADDPIEPDTATDGRLLVLPFPGGDRTWDDLCAEDSALAPWCEDRWLAARRRLGPAPDSLVECRRALHAVAEWILAPARHDAVGRIGLRWTRDGFGTPFLPGDRQLRVTGADLVVQSGTSAERQTITALGEAAAFAGVAPAEDTGVFAPSEPWVAERPLAVDAGAARCLADWFGFATSVLEELRRETVAPGRVQLWPEHFDVAVDAGDEAAGRRVNLGASPGDEDHPRPYLYVGPWGSAPRVGEYWNEPFGASLDYEALLDADDQRAAALTFLRRGIELIGAGRGAS